jgi:hypothetical protein
MYILSRNKHEIRKITVEYTLNEPIIIEYDTIEVE